MARHYNGTYRAAGETAFHSGLAECRHEIDRLRRKIAGWQRIAAQAATELSRIQAERQIAACERAVGTEERRAAEFARKAADYDARKVAA